LEIKCLVAVLASVAVCILPMTAFSAQQPVSSVIEISEKHAGEIGRRIWQNESGGRLEGLTAWNEGEDFPSLGICHFIWYPHKKNGPFVETFPHLLRFMHERGVRLPKWLAQSDGCPWRDRKSFFRDFNGLRLRQLRELLAATIHLQIQFAAERMKQSATVIAAAAEKNERERILRNFFLVAQKKHGVYALIDYVNFKGEGTSPQERYNGVGWGLLQVLREMGDGEPLQEFAGAAERVLQRRVAASPPQRRESRWLAGWLKRCRTYSEQLE
jgi:hypothetical protein